MSDAEITDDEFTAMLRRTFFEEAQAAADEIEAGILRLERQPDDHGTINLLFRMVHNTKGAAGSVGFESVVGVSHAFENLLCKAKNRELEVTKGLTDLMLECLDAFKASLEAARGGQAGVRDDGGIGAKINTFLETGVVERQVRKSPPASAATAAPTSAQRSDNDSIRVDIGKIEKLATSVGELILLRTMYDNLLGGLDNREFAKLNYQLAKLASELQETSMSMRLVPVRGAFMKMQRIVRDTAAKLGKSVDIVTHGEDTELDKNILENLTDPLTHIVRNAVDHGIGQQGCVTLSAFYLGNFAVIEVADNGRGINRRKVLDKALAMHVVTEAEAATLPDEKVFDLLFHPGLSTAEKVTDVSGRGVGMDVVKSNVTRLNGEIRIGSVEGKGTKISLRLPTQVSITDGFVVSVGSHNFVIPTSHVDMTLGGTKSQSFSLAKSSKDTWCVQLGGQLISVVDVGELLSVPGRRPLHPDNTFIISNIDGRKYAFMVDQVTSKQQVVMKMSDRWLAGLAFASGYTILGDGHPALIFDLRRLLDASQPIMKSA